MKKNNSNNKNLKNNSDIYVIGKVSDLPRRHVIRKFERTAAQIRSYGYNATTPIDIIPEEAEWDEAMKISIRRMLLADFVVAQEDWTQSRGATIEFMVARTLEIPVIEERFLTEVE